MFGFGKKKKLAAEKAAAEKAAAEKAAAEKAAAEKAAAEKAAAEKAAAEKAAAEKAAAEKAAAEKAAAEKAAAKKPAPAKKAEAVKKAEPEKKPAPAKKTEAVKKAEPEQKPAPAAAAPAADSSEITAAGKGQFVIKRAGDGRYMFNVHAANTQVIASSQMYSSMSACRTGINSVGANAPIAAIEDQTLASVNVEKCPKFQIYFDKSGKYRFNLLAANGQNILACTQGYTQKNSCKNGIRSVINNAHAMIVLPGEDD